jgi:glycine betaine/choline ABC-type transport system substrate-binding protein
MRLKAGNPDLYVEYTGAGLVDMLDQKAGSELEEACKAACEAFVASTGSNGLRRSGSTTPTH